MNKDEYEDKMLEAFINKPEKFEWYKKAFAKYDLNGVERIAWVWSWWAFFEGFVFLLYRKAYLAAMILFVITTIVTPIVPFSNIVIMIVTGGYGVYFIYKKYIKLKREIESKIEDPLKRIEIMRELGGYNQWVLIVAVVLNIIGAMGVIAYFALLLGLIKS